MKRIVLISLAILLIGGGIFVYLWWNNKPSFKEEIPLDAKAIISIDLHNIRNTILTELASHPTDLFEDDSSDFSKKIKELGILKPNYLVGYYIDKDSISGWVVTLPIQSKQKIVDQLLKNNYQESHEIFKNSKGNRLFFVEESKITLLLSNQNNSAKGFNAFLNSKKKYLPKDHLIITQLSKSRDHISVYLNKSKILDDWSLIALNFEKDKISCEGELKSKKLKKTKKWTTHVVNKELFSFRINLIPELITAFSSSTKNSIKKVTNISIDSLLTKGAHVECLLTGFHEQQDTVVSFDYDENFNMVEKKELQTKLTPSVSFFLSPVTPSSKEYLINNGILKIKDTTLLLTAIPASNIKVESLKGNKLYCTNFAQTVFKEQESSAICSIKLNSKSIPWDKVELPYTNTIKNSGFSNVEIAIVPHNNGGLLKAKIETSKEEHSLFILKELFNNFQ